MAANGKDLVDLEIVWKTKNYNGERENYSVAPDKPASDGNGGWKDKDGKPVDEQGYPLPPKPADLPEGQAPPDPAKPTAGTFVVSLGEIHTYRLSVAAEVQTQIFRFEEMRDRILVNEDWMFFAPSYESTQPKTKSGPSGKGGSEMGYVGGTKTIIEAKDPDPAKTAETIKMQHGLLQSVGGVIHLTGRLMGVLNDLGQMYAGADRGAWIDTPEDYVPPKK
jgi:hypothetical protein